MKMGVLAITASLLFALCPCLAAAPSLTPTLQTPFLRLSISPDNGGFDIQDRQGSVAWQSSPFHARFGQVTFTRDGKQQRANLDRCDVQSAGNGLEVTFRPRPSEPSAWVRVSIQPLRDGKALEFSYRASDALAIDNLRLLDDALWVTDRDQGYVAVPVREGMLIRAGSGLQFTHQFGTYAYEGCHMAMLGVVKQGAAALLTWPDPYVTVDVRSVLTNAVWAHGQQVLSPSLVLRKSATSFQLHLLGKGDSTTIAQAYRQIARDRGWLVPWDEKLKGHPERSKLFGAINFKLWSTLDRSMNEESTKEVRVRVNWTFDEAAQVGEHLKNDLKLDKVLFTMGGWIHRGYDNQHPDILPTAPECGGDPAFTDCARRIRQLGYLFCLHDNYQDIYRDSPSWDENLIMKTRDGKLARGGHWAGGVAFLTCSQKALELARRPQNLPAVKKLCDADAYFIDTTYAADLQECFDPNHPLTRADDMRWKQALSDYGREVFGIFGSECGREWAIPHSDFFEGLTGVSGQAYHNTALLKEVGGEVVPLFEMVYRDSIAIYGKYGYDIARAAPYVLSHLVIGRPLNYHNVPSHLYWKRSRPATDTSPAGVSQAVFTRADQGWAEGMHPFDRFVKNTAEILSPLNEITSQTPLSAHQFLTADHAVQRSIFGTGLEAVEVTVNGSAQPFEFQSKAGGDVLLPPFGFVVESPRFVAFLAQRWNAVTYESGALFTLRSLDQNPIGRSSRIRIYHGFGEPRLKFGNGQVEVPKESLVNQAGESL